MRTSRLVVCAVLVSLAAGCGGAPEPPPAPEPAQRVESPSLGLALAAVPEGLALAANEEGRIVLSGQPEPEQPPGTFTVEATPEQTAGVNLVQAVNDQKARIEGLPEGDFQGQLELVGPTGTAYMTRGRYLDEAGTRTEEVRIFALHPSANRMVVVTLVYPVGGDPQPRAQQAMEVLGEMEALAPAETPEP